MEGIGRIGRVEIGRVFDTSLLGFTAQAWFPKFSRAEVAPHEHWLCPHHYDAEFGGIPMPVHSWPLRVENHDVMIDTSIGNDKPRGAFGEMHQLNTRYLELRQHDIEPEDIHFVLCTHLHIDHVGMEHATGERPLGTDLPQRKYMVSRREYEAAKDEAADPASPPHLRATFEESIHPIVESGKAVLVADLHELLDCLLLRSAPGHSPGHIRIELRSEGNTGGLRGRYAALPDAGAAMALE